MNIAVIGSRGFQNKELLETALHQYLKVLEDTDINAAQEQITIISGGAIGADTLAKEFANENNFAYEEIRPIKEGRIYYLYRNVEIVSKADKIIAFWDGKSRGTKFVIDYATARNKNIQIIRNA